MLPYKIQTKRPEMLGLLSDLVQNPYFMGLILSVKMSPRPALLHRDELNTRVFSLPAKLWLIKVLLTVCLCRRVFACLLMYGESLWSFNYYNPLVYFHLQCTVYQLCQESFRVLGGYKVQISEKLAEVTHKTTFDFLWLKMTVPIFSQFAETPPRKSA